MVLEEPTRWAAVLLESKGGPLEVTGVRPAAEPDPYKWLWPCTVGSQGEELGKQNKSLKSLEWRGRLVKT